MAWLYAILSVLLVSAVSLVGIMLMRKQLSEQVLLVLLSLSAGTLLGGAFLHFLPEASGEGFTVPIAMYVLAGFVLFFLLEKGIHYHHHEKDTSIGHGHAYHLAPLNIAGDALHNFIDGLVIAGSYLASVPLGITATIAVLLHEIPQELADFGVLLYSGWSKRKAILFNLLAASTAVIGAVMGLLLGEMHGFEGFILPFAAGTFLYIAASSLVPELHKHCRLRDTILHVGTMLLGIGIMIALLYLPVH